MQRSSTKSWLIKSIRTSMWTFLVRPVGVLCLSSVFLVMTQLERSFSKKINNVPLTPYHMKNRKVGLKAEDSKFTLEGIPFQILSGTIHYFRVPREYWKNSLQKLQACGFNTVTIYIPWNLHEPRRDLFDFAHNLDLRAFLTMASEVGLWVILSPGPYIGSDLDLGGLPSWLLSDPNMKLRTTYKGFTKAVNHYFNTLIPKIESLQYKEGGPIIAVQVENEYGAYHLDKHYLPYLKKALQIRGIKELLMTADAGQDLRNGHLKNVLATLHMKNIKKNTYETLSSIQGRHPILMMLYTAKSLDSWGIVRNTLDSHVIMENVREMFHLNFSLNLYVFHGGTNFGFMGGAMSLDYYLPMVTSYDYGGLLTEDGDYTPEYFNFQDFFHSVLELPRIILPVSKLKTVYNTLTVTHYISLWNMLPYLGKFIRSTKPLSMETLPINNGSGQSFGYILYETVITSGGFLTSKNHVQDRGQVYLNEKYLGVLDHAKDQLFIPDNQDHKDYMTLSILVENQGRLASGLNINTERKGLTGDIYLNNSPLRKFKIYSLEMKPSLLKKGNTPKIWKPILYPPPTPAFFHVTLRVSGSPKDTFIRLKNWTKGVVFINGRNLGRYWNKGPQETLYLPGSWLEPGQNEIILFEEFKPGFQIEFRSTPFLGY
ncbi:beta-galactosidase-1-like protein 2 [Erinaceus europaeus]|uniref:Beta-galactosidase n=1 Tax=Erinaceus europaeus TaxID=9365 RepID=A0A1S3WM23_ERIEU|nr:beta-galactosidase-1-like protein 2 [Erinaceus europaeus]